MPMTISTQSTVPVILGRVEAVVMAAGQGSPPRPLTERYAKPVLPIDGRPVIVTLLDELAFAQRVVVVLGHLGHQRLALLRGVSAPRAPRSSSGRRSASVTLVAPAEAMLLNLVLGCSTRCSALVMLQQFAAIVSLLRQTPSLGAGPGSGPRARARVCRTAGSSASTTRRASGRSAARARGRVDHAARARAAGKGPWELGTAFQLAVDAGLDVRAVGSRRRAI